MSEVRSWSNTPPHVHNGQGVIHSFCFFFLSRFIIFKNYLFILFFWLHWVFVATCGFSLVSASGGYSSLQFTGFSLWWRLLLQSTGSRVQGLSSCSAQA